MYLGIDVGGTFTDGIVLDGSRVVKTVKKPTRREELRQTLLSVLEELLQDAPADQITRAVISTTLVTNLIATDRAEPAAMILVPGPGMPRESFTLFPNTCFLNGSIDFRGRMVESLDFQEMERTINTVLEQGFVNIGVVCKFSNRNPILEESIRENILKKDGRARVFLGSEIAGQLNFRRRIATTYYTARTMQPWKEFAAAVDEAVKHQGLQCELEIMKADGGTMKLARSFRQPCETVFSGPASSSVGAVALTMCHKNAVVLDIGGTTSDISLLMDGQPLHASKGAVLEGQYTHVKAFAVHSVPLGGDSVLVFAGGSLELAPREDQMAACFGGQKATVTDVFNYRYELGLGDPDRSRQALNVAAGSAGLDIEEITTLAIEMVTGRLQDEIRAMSRQWENEPAYRVWEVVHGRRFELKEIIGIGAAAGAIVPVLAATMGVEYMVHPLSPCANALGACVARPTLAVDVHIDTVTGRFAVDTGGVQGEFRRDSLQLAQAKDFAIQQMQAIARGQGLEEYMNDCEINHEEQFNVIRGYSTSGKVFDIGVQIKPGLMNGYEGVIV